jgi:hypothetical protein
VTCSPQSPSGPLTWRPSRAWCGLGSVRSGLLRFGNDVAQRGSSSEWYLHSLAIIWVSTMFDIWASCKSSKAKVSCLDYKDTLRAPGSTRQVLKDIPFCTIFCASRSACYRISAPCSCHLLVLIPSWPRYPSPVTRGLIRAYRVAAKHLVALTVGP